VPPPTPSCSLSVEPEPSHHPAPDLAPTVRPLQCHGGAGRRGPCGTGLSQLGLSWLGHQSHPGDRWMRERRPGPPGTVVPRALVGSVMVTSEDLQPREAAVPEVFERRSRAVSHPEWARMEPEGGSGKEAGEESPHLRPEPHPGTSQAPEPCRSEGQ